MTLRSYLSLRQVATSACQVATRSGWRAFIAVIALMLAVPATASANPARLKADYCGRVLVSGGSWLGGSGVDAKSNYPYMGDGNNSCGGWSTSNPTVQMGLGWQCVELAQRLYNVRGWYSGTFAGVGWAGQIFDVAPNLGMTRQANGGITLIVPGDMIVEQGHVSLVDTVTATTVVAVEQNANASGRHTYTRNGGTLTGAYTSVRGVVHSPKNSGSQGGSNYVPGSWTRWNSGDHKAISAPPSLGSVWEGTLGNLLTSQVTGTVPVYSCNIASDEFTSLSTTCEGQKVNGLLGFIYKAKPAGVPTRPIYRCTSVPSGEHFDSPANNCEGQRYENLLGYAVAYTAWNRWNDGDHKAILGPGPSGATWEATLGHLLTSQVAGTIPLYSCNVGADEFTSLTSNCEGQKVNGLLGFIYKTKPASVPTRPIYRCTSGEHFDSPASNCEGQRYESLLGYAVAYTAWNRWNNGDHKAILGPGPSGATWEATLGHLLTSQVTGTVPVYSCNVGADEFTSLTSNCEGQKVNGLLGFIYKTKPAGVPTRPIYRCTSVPSGEHFDSPANNCEGQRYENLLGYAVAYT